MLLNILYEEEVGFHAAGREEGSWFESDPTRCVATSDKSLTPVIASHLRLFTLSMTYVRQQPCNHNNNDYYYCYVDNGVLQVYSFAMP